LYPAARRRLTIYCRRNYNIIMKKEKFITEKYLDKRLNQHTQVIVAAVDGVLEKRLKKVDLRFDVIESKLISHDKRFDTLETKFDSTWKILDGYVKAQENFKQEFVIMKEEMRQVKKVLKQKLGVEISAM